MPAAFQCRVLQPSGGKTCSNTLLAWQTMAHFLTIFQVKIPASHLSFLKGKRTFVDKRINRLHVDGKYGNSKFKIKDAIQSIATLANVQNKEFLYIFSSQC